MFTNDQVNYQMPADAHHSWVETWQFPIVIPEENIHALVYVAARPKFGVSAFQIMVCGSLIDSRAELLHLYDNQHLPMPEDFSDFTSESGLSFKVLKAPRDYRLDYVGTDGTEIHVDWLGLMDPFDIHDPDHSPQARSVEDLHGDIDATGKHDAGHMDMTGRIRGTMTVRGKTYEVDSIERMDRSWGPRNPTIIRNMYIVSATIDENLAFHMICPWDPDKPQGDQFQLTHGYVLDHGEVYGLTTDLEMRVQHMGAICSSLEMTVTDTRGKSYDLMATANVGCPWHPYPSALTHNGLMTWHHAGKRGYGIVLANYCVPWLNQRQGRVAGGLDPKIWC
ncbi:MAG: hypothetical protein VX874_09530 [Pseudomonadota bacterium]|nr:hypothetical protein [Pseudomonadota bacterium]